MELEKEKKSSRIRKTNSKESSAKRCNIVLVKESSLLYKERAVKSPEDSYNLLKHFLEDNDRKYFIATTLDIKNQPVSVHVYYVGSINAYIFHPREVMKSAILSNVTTIIAGHNHPSGHTTPSGEDQKVTKRLKEAEGIIRIELLNHIIVGKDSYLSLNEKGYL